MSIELIITIVGVLLTILFGIWGVSYTSKQRTRTELIYFLNSCIPLFESVVKDLEDVEIKYKNQVISENLILYKGTIFNSGNTDIDETIVHNPLSIKLPENFQWKKSKIIDKSEDLIIKDDLKENDLVFEWDILKENEYFTFDSIIEYNPENEEEENQDEPKKDLIKRLKKNITFNHRIKDLKEVNQEKLPSKPASNWTLLFISLYFLAFIGAGLYYSAGQFIYPEYEFYYGVSLDSETNFVKVNPINENYVELINQNGDSIEKIESDKFVTSFNGEVSIKEKSLDYFNLIVGGFFAIASIFALIGVIYSEISQRKLYRRIKTIIDKYDNYRTTTSFSMGILNPGSYSRETKYQ